MQNHSNRATAQRSCGWRFPSCITHYILHVDTRQLQQYVSCICSTPRARCSLLFPFHFWFFLFFGLSVFAHTFSIPFGFVSFVVRPKCVCFLFIPSHQLSASGSDVVIFFFVFFFSCRRQQVLNNGVVQCVIVAYPTHGSLWEQQRHKYTMSRLAHRQNVDHFHSRMDMNERVCVCVFYFRRHLTEHKRTEQLLTSTHRSLHHLNVVSWINATYSR